MSDPEPAIHRKGSKPNLAANSAFENPELLNSVIRIRISARPRRFRDGTLEYIDVGYPQVGRTGNPEVGRTLTIHPPVPPALSN
jgi:hypothetical protein